MKKQVKTQTTVGVELGILWSAISKDMISNLPKAIPDLVKETEVIEGDGGLGTVFLVKFGTEVKTLTYQKEKITEMDESAHRIAVQVIEGGHLDVGGFSHYETFLQLTATGERETMVDVTVAYESNIEDDTIPSKSSSSSVYFIKCLEDYLVNGSS